MTKIRVCGHIIAYTEMELFQMVLTEEFVEMVILIMNKHLGNKLMLGKFYKWLGNCGGWRNQCQCSTGLLSISMQSCH
jgi:hypothetical protein